MAGQQSLTIARQQGAHLPCSDESTTVTVRPVITKFSAEKYTTRVVKVPVDLVDDADEAEDDEFAKGAGWITHPKATRRLMNYWSRGKGAAKIRWFTDGSMRRCIRQLRKYFPQNPGGLCANLHKRATGEWPRGGLIPS